MHHFLSLQVFETKSCLASLLSVAKVPHNLCISTIFVASSSVTASYFSKGQSTSSHLEVPSSQVSTASCSNYEHNTMSDSKEAARSQTAYQLNLPAASANALKEQGEDSAKRRGKSFEPTELRFPNPKEENSMHQAGEESLQRRRHVTENIASSYRSSSS